MKQRLPAKLFSRKITIWGLCLYPALTGLN